MPVMTCNCENVQQDNLHGPKRRVFNPTAKKDPAQYRCTVCGTEKTKGGGGFDPKSKKKK